MDMYEIIINSAFNLNQRQRKAIMF